MHAVSAWTRVSYERGRDRTTLKVCGGGEGYAQCIQVGVLRSRFRMQCRQVKQAQGLTDAENPSKRASLHSAKRKLQLSAWLPERASASAWDTVRTPTHTRRGVAATSERISQFNQIGHMTELLVLTTCILLGACDLKHRTLRLKKEGRKMNICTIQICERSSANICRVEYASVCGEANTKNFAVHLLITHYKL